MTALPPENSTPRLLDRAVTGAENAAHSAQNAFDGAMHGAVDGAHRSAAALRESSHKLMDRAQHAGIDTVTYIRGEPVKAMFIAAAAGAALALLASVLTRRH